MIIVEHQVSKLILQSLFGGLVGLLLQWKHEILAVTVSGADRVLEETMTHHTFCSKSSCHWPFIYSFISVDKSANDAEHHLWADTLQPGTAVKVSTFFFFFVYLMLTWERDLFFLPGFNSFDSNPSCLAGAWAVSYANLHPNQPFKV
jgi:hypothetical protein